MNAFDRALANMRASNEKIREYRYQLSMEYSQVGHFIHMNEEYIVRLSTDKYRGLYSDYILYCNKNNHAAEPYDLFLRVLERYKLEQIRLVMDT